MMRHTFLIIILLLLSSFIKAQHAGGYIEGTVSYVSSQSVYVKFPSTTGINAGDTLYQSVGDQLKPLLQVKELSSISCVCVLLTSENLKINDKLSAKIKPKTEPTKASSEVIKPTEENKPVKKEVFKDTSFVTNNISKTYKQMIRGRISVASASSFSNTISPNDQRMRYTFSLNANNIGNSRVSAESYISFVHRDKDWDTIKKNIFYGLKIYCLAVQYDISENTKIWIGRKINPRISNVGPIDGVQFETKLKSFSTGIITGTRPDLYDNSFNSKLFQYGAYLGHDKTIKKNSFQSTLALLEQKNNGQTDRRFAYLQHANTIGNKLSFFGSAEFDLYKRVKVLEVTNTSTTPRLTNLYLSVQYRIIKPLSLSLSYSERQNIIYYESYKDLVERLLEAEKQTGYGLQLYFRPVSKLSMGLSGGYRNQKGDRKASQNAYGYVTYQEIPIIKISTTVSATLIESSYINGKIYSLGFEKALMKSRLTCGLSYRYVDYRLIDAENNLIQHLGEANLNWRIYKSLNLSVNYEGTFETVNQFNQFYVNLSKSF